jgi:hypothetical protein
MAKNSVTQRLSGLGFPATQTLLDLRGSVPVSEPQDFAAIRKAVISWHRYAQLFCALNQQ